jgi:hypothetical protein
MGGQGWENARMGGWGQDTRMKVGPRTGTEMQGQRQGQKHEDEDRDMDMRRDRIGQG